MHVPLVDLAWQRDAVADDVATGFERVLQATAFVGGPDVAAFEDEYAQLCGVAHCVGVANGTDALEMAYRAAGVRAGDEVILAANTFIATAEAVSRVGARVVLVDCDDSALLLDPQQLADALTPRTRAVVATDLYGQVAAFDALSDVLAGRDVLVFEDAAQSQGASRNGRVAGSFGRAAGTSFYPGKNLGAYGDAGAVLTDDAGVAATVRAIGAHGSVVKYEHDVLGFNSRLDTLQAVVLRAKLARLAEWNQLRLDAAARYGELLRDLSESGRVQLPVTLPGNVHVFHLYVVRVAHRDEVVRELNAEGIGAAIHYPKPVHLHGAYADLNIAAGSLPVAERAAGEILSLPIYPGITADQQQRVVEVLRKAVDA